MLLSVISAKGDHRREAIMAPLKRVVPFLRLFGLAAVFTLALLPAALGAESVTIRGLTFINKGLVGVGRMPASLRDKFGETFGSGSGLAADPKSWTQTSAGYSGVLYMLPDRGYNVSGTIDYMPRINKLSLALTPIADPTGPATTDLQTSITANLDETILLTDSAGAPLTGLDPEEGGIRVAANGFPDLPQARNSRISIDAESLARLPDGSFFIGDEYGPYIYRFSAGGRLIAAIRPPEAFIPKRKGRDNFSSNNPGPGAVAPEPPDPESGRQNNQGFEGLSLTPGGRFLVVALQSAARQDSGAMVETRRYTRLLYYDLLDLDRPVLVREHVVPLPVFENAQNKPSLAVQSELLALSENQFLLLCRDSGNGYGSENATSRYRNIELLDMSQATNIAGSPYDGSVPVAPNGKLRDEIVPATLTPFIDINDSVQLGRFGLHNGVPNDRNNLSEKWEGMTLVSALDPANPLDYFLFVANDNDFITQSGYQAGASYSHPSGIEVDTMLLVYRISLPAPLN
jgi:hypothetical protein